MTCHSRRSSRSAPAARGAHRRATRAVRAGAGAASRSRSAQRCAPATSLRRSEPRREPTPRRNATKTIAYARRRARDSRDPGGRARPVRRRDAGGARRDRHGRGVPRLEATGAGDDLDRRVARRRRRWRRDRGRRLALSRGRRTRRGPCRRRGPRARCGLGAAGRALGLGPSASAIGS